MTRRRMLSIAALCGAVLLLPGWRGVLVPAPHEDVLAASRAADPTFVFGVTRANEPDGEVWHAQYHGSRVASLLRAAGMGGALTKLVAPAFVAHIPPRAERADGYFRVETAVHWPWWRPGGGVAWHDPRVPEGDASR